LGNRKIYGHNAKEDAEENQQRTLFVFNSRYQTADQSAHRRRQRYIAPKAAAIFGQYAYGSDDINQYHQKSIEQLKQQTIYQALSEAK